MSGVEQAQRYFSDRGVQEETFKRYRIEIVSTPSHEQLVEWLGENSYCLEAAIVFPNLICDPDTAELSIHAHYVRCFPPPIGSDGKPRKFLATLGSSYRPYVLPEILDVAYDIAEPIYIVEKQAAALLLRQNGLHAIALDGTFGSAAKRVEGEPVKLHEVLSEWDWVGRPLYLCFDSDFRKRQSVLQGLVRTYILFTIAGAVVKVLQWDAQFTGLDDFVASRAGLDIEKQRAELTTLASAAGADAKQAAADWIIPQYRGLFETEVAAILPNEGQRSLLADIVHKALGTTPGDLKRSWRNLTKPDVPASEVIVEETEPWPDPVIPSELGEKLLGRWKQHVITSDVNYWTLVLWQILTHLKDSLSLMPQLGLCSALKRCGKTRTLEVLEQTVWKGLLAASVSPAATIRTIEKYEPCFLIDEFDAFLSQNEEFRGVLNTCHSRGVKHIRCQPETHEPQAFNAFCAVAIALIGELPGTVEDRAIVLHLERKQVSERVVPVRKVPSEIFNTLRREIRRFALDYAKEVLTAIPVLPKLTNDRALENWEPLAQIAAVLGDPWPRRAFLAAKLLTPSDSDLQDFTIQLLVALKHLFLVRGLDQPGREEELLLTEQILLVLNKDKEAPWADRKQYFHGLTAKKLSVELRRFRVKSRKNSTTELHGYCWKDLVPHFRRYLGDEDPPPPPGSPSPPPPPPPSTPSASEDSPEESSPISSFSEESSQDSLSSKKFSKPPFQSGNPAVSPYKGLISNGLSSSPDPVEKEKKLDLSSDPASDLNDLYTTTYKVIPPDGRIKPPGPGQNSKSIPPSTPQAPFCTPSHPERLVFLDLETFHPYEGDYPQPPDKTVAQLLRKQNNGEAHPWAKDPRRCALRFLTVHDTEGTFGSVPLTIDLQENSVLPDHVREALATCTLVGHNLDFDITILRRYGIPVSNSILDTMLASRLLGMGKEKFKVPETAYCDLSDEELDERTSSEMEDPNPVDNDLAAVVRRYLGIRMEKAHTKLGGSDWGRSDLSNDQRLYIPEDVIHLPPLWKVLERELKEASLDHVFRERVEFFPHLNQIKMIGNPVDPVLCEADHKSVTAEKEAVREELRVMFADRLYPVCESDRKKTVKVEVEGGKFKRVPVPTHEEFSPSKRRHVIEALGYRGLYVENVQEATLRKIDSPETRLLLKYGQAKKRINAIEAIVRSAFPDGRVRAQGWNQLAARTGRIISSKPNLQQVPKDWRTAFRVEPPKIWLKADLSLIEVVILAVVTGDSALIDLLRRDDDVYVIVASRLFNVKPIRREEEGCVTELLRDRGKPIVLGTNYGLTIYGLQKQLAELGLEVSLDEAQLFFDTFFEMFPGIAAYHAKAAEDALTLDYVRTAGGQRRFLPPLLNDATDHYWPSLELRKKILMNTPIQGGQADVQVRAVNKFMPRLPAGVEVVNLVHDEVDAVVTNETRPIAVEVIGNAFREAFAELYGNTLVPNIKFSKGPGWGELQELSK